MILGSGAPHFEQGIRELVERYPQNIAVKSATMKPFRI